MASDLIRAARERAAFGVARSFTGRRWILREACDEAVAALKHAHGISEVLAHILAVRGVGVDEAADVLLPTLKRLLPEPNTLKDMQRAVMRVKAAIEAGEIIAVYGDYDVDGSSSAALLAWFLKSLGSKPLIYIPDRLSEGYGPNTPAMMRLKDAGARVIVTVDCGAAADDALTAARDAGLDVIVLDHHAVTHQVPAYAQVNPNQPGDMSGLGFLAAAGVTFLFLVALNRTLRESGYYEGRAELDLREALDLVGLATVCDVVPLVGVNRAFVRAGLDMLSRGRRVGLARLADVSRTSPPFTPYHLGYVFGPRINAGGRVGRCMLGVELLTATEPGQASEIAMQLDLHNRERQALEKQILEQAMAMAELQANAPFILVAEEGWHAGVVGIVAGRLKDRFNKPALVAGFEGGMGKGSARSIPGIDIGAAVRGAFEAGILLSGGGHAMAAGYSLEAGKLDIFRDHLTVQFANAGEALNAATELHLDAMISIGGASVALVDEIAKAGPFGAGNPEPMVVATDVRVSFADVVGQDHVRLRLSGMDGSRLDAIAFRHAKTPLGQALLGTHGRPIHLAGKLKADVWNGRQRVQLQIEDAAECA
ncbi:MAG: single-stranded-DNA-specific exonuclease RecJ [Alphaproteobacteria bacterium]|nr:single-stranded-DNA-specific exonuclease RecJ [Alphaproteobacteria bacterium]